MDQFDRDLKRRAREEPFPLPDSFVQRLRETCDSLEEPPRRKPERRQLSHWGAWFAAVAASLLVVLPNVSPLRPRCWSRSRCWALWYR